MQALITAADQPAQQFFQEQMASIDGEIAQCNLMIQQADKEQTMELTNANLSKIMQSDSDEDLED